ncbi:MAG: PD40 domain-containing protein [Prolixibacteraceae bacterium]|nr:PD40 domain-containing protein [Prolixibacteraceae bacterium]
MKIFEKIILLEIALLVISVHSFAQGKNAHMSDSIIYSGKYFGQKPPGKIPELFAPELMNAEAGYHSTIVFSPDLTEAFWSPMERSGCMMHSKIVDGVWSAPERIYFGHEKEGGEPAFSPDGNKLYFQSFRQPKQGDPERERIWFVERIPEGWSEPKLIDETILEHPSHWTFTFAANGNLYFTSEKKGVRGGQDIYYAEFDGKKFLEPQDLGEMINTYGKELAPCIAPDESFIVFTRVGDDTKKADLYVSFKKADGSWAKAIELGPHINTVNNDLCASLTPDGKYLFFLSQREGWHRILWVSSEIIEELKQQSLMD